MSKFNTSTTRPQVHSPIVTSPAPTGTNHYGAPGHSRDLRSELFLLAVANMVGEAAYHEDAGSRDTRYADLVRRAAVEDPRWTAAMLRWLRSDGNMRSASLVGAAEYVKARAGIADDQAPTGRSVVDSVLQRPDEPGEMIAYWTSAYGRNVPKPIKRGVADAVTRLYDERALLKWDSPAKGFRFGDVLELVHPSPRADWQGALFAHAISRRHNRDNPIPDVLGMLGVHAELMGWPVEKRRALFERGNGVDGDTPTSVLRQAGMTWEQVAGWLQGPMTGPVWSALAPTMGFMAQLRNLRNFDEAGMSDEIAETVAARLSDPEQVARSRQFPFRFLSAYRAVSSLRWAHPLEKALQASLVNVPALSGRTLIVVDRSPSMFPGNYFSTPSRSDISCADQAAVFGGALALRAAQPTLVVYGGTSREVAVPKAGALLRLVDGLGEAINYTDTAGAVREHYRGHDRVVIVTDEQTATADVGSTVPAHVPVYTWNMAGYRHGHGMSGSSNRHTFGGLTDHAFRLIPTLESARNGAWPWETQG